MLKSSGKLFYYFILFASLVLSGCVDSWLQEEKSKDIVAFYFSRHNNSHFQGELERYDGLIEGTSVTVFMPGFVSDRTAMAASFITTANTVKVGGKTQISGVTLNDFSANRKLTYTAIAEDGSSRDYDVKVLDPPSRREIVFLRLLKSVNPCLSKDAEGVIDNNKNEIHIYREGADADCVKVIPSFRLSSGSYLKTSGITQQSGFTAVNFEGREFMPYTFVAEDSKTEDWKIYLKTLNSEAEVKDFYVEYAAGGYNQVFEGVINYPNINVYLGDEISLRSFSKFASAPVVKVSEGASYETLDTPEPQGDSAILYKIRVTSSNKINVQSYNVRFSYMTPGMLSFKLQPQPSPGIGNDIKTEIPGSIYEARNDGGNIVGSIHLKFPVGKKVQDSYVPTFSFAGYKIFSNGVSDGSAVINRRTRVDFIRPLNYMIYSIGGDRSGYASYEIEMDNEAPRLAGTNALLAKVEDNEEFYATLYVEPEQYYDCEDGPKPNNVSLCEDQSGDIDIIAYDNITEYDALKCGLFYSHSDNINTLEAIKANGILLGDYYSFSGAYYNKGVDENSQYVQPLNKCAFRVKQVARGNVYFNMIIKDKAGHETALSDKATKISLNDYSPPQIHNHDLTITPKDLNGKIELQWLSAYDENDKLRYSVYHSDQSIETKSKVEKYGAVIEEYRAFVCDEQGLCSYELSAENHSKCLDGCYFNVMVKDVSGNIEAYGNVKFTPDTFQGKPEEKAEFFVSDYSDYVDGYFTYMDSEKAFNKYSTDNIGDTENFADYLVFPLGVRAFGKVGSRNSWKSGDHTFQILNVTPDGEVSRDAYSGDLKTKLFPSQGALQEDYGFAKVRLGFFKLTRVSAYYPHETAVLLVGDKLNRYVKLRMVDIRKHRRCDSMECVWYNALIMTETPQIGLDPMADNYHYLDNGSLLKLSNGNIFVSHTIQSEQDNRSRRRHILKIYDLYKQDWKEIGTDQFQEVSNYSLNLYDDGYNPPHTVPEYGTEIHPIPPTANTFYKFDGKDGQVRAGIVVVSGEGSFTFSDMPATRDRQRLVIPRHQHNLMARFFSNDGSLIKTEKLETAVIANQYPSISNLSNGDLMIVYPVSKFLDNGKGWLKLKTDIKLAVYLPDKGEFLVKNKIIKTIEKDFAKATTDRMSPLLNPITQGDFGELVPGGVSSVAAGDKVVIAYRDPGDDNKGKFVVCNNRGEVISGEVAFSEYPVASDIYYIRDPLYAFESFVSGFSREEDAAEEYKKISYEGTNFARITVGAFKNTNRVLISFVPDKGAAAKTAKIVIVR